MKFRRAGEGKLMNGFLPSRPGSMDYALQGLERRSARPFRLSDNIIRGRMELSHFREKGSEGYEVAFGASFDKATIVSWYASVLVGWENQTTALSGEAWLYGFSAVIFTSLN